MCAWRNETIGNQILGNLFYSGKLDKCRVNIRYRKYTWIDKQINWLCTQIYPSLSWCGRIYWYSFINGIWRKQRRMGDKVKRVTLWNQAIKFKLFWSYKECSINNWLSSIRSLPLFILKQQPSSFNLCWWFCNSITQIRDNHIIDIINQ